MMNEEERRVRENLKKMDMLWSDDFAVLLGLKRSTIDDGRSDLPEEERLFRLGTLYLPRNAMETEEQQNIVWSRFCALYLPATVDRFINPPTITSKKPEDIAKFKIFSPCSEMIVHVQHNAYFAKYLRSKTLLAANGKQLPRVVAERVAELGFAWEPELRSSSSTELEQHYLSILASAVQLLSTLCTSFVKEDDQESVVPKALRDRLKPLMKTWSQRYKNQILGDVSLRVLAAWSSELDGGWFNGEAKKVRKRTLGWDECGLPQCEVKTGLKACGKCQTVRYCTPEHQRIHWKYPFGTQHSQLCHKTKY